MSELRLARLRYIDSDGSVIWQRRGTVGPTPEELKDLLKNKENQNLRFKDLGPKEENGVLVWEFRQREGFVAKQKREHREIKEKRRKKERAGARPQ